MLYVNLGRGLFKWSLLQGVSRGDYNGERLLAFQDVMCSVLLGMTYFSITEEPNAGIIIRKQLSC